MVHALKGLEILVVLDLIGRTTEIVAEIFIIYETPLGKRDMRVDLVLLSKICRRKVSKN